MAAFVALGTGVLLGTSPETFGATELRMPFDRSLTAGWGGPHSPQDPTGTACVRVDVSTADGLDFVLNLNTPVLAVASGVITEVHPANDNPFGRYVRMEVDGTDLEIGYAHLNSIEAWVANNTPVEVGEILGKVGATGTATGSHLHLELRRINGDGSRTEVSWHNRTIDGFKAWMVTVKGNADLGLNYAGTLTKGATTTADEPCFRGSSLIETGDSVRGTTTLVSGEDIVPSTNCAHEHGTPVPSPCDDGEPKDADGDGILDDNDTEGPPGNSNGVDGADDCSDNVDNNGNTLTDGADPGCPIIHHPPKANAGPDRDEDEGNDVTLNGSGSSDEDGDIVSWQWDFDGDGFDDASGEVVEFTNVGQDGVFEACLLVTDSGGRADVDCTTITIHNVAPSVSLSSNAPVNEGSAVTVTGTVTDPGWLDPLTATIDWDDGTVEPISGTLENVRPNATLSFSASHTYGDNGTFAAEVCASDDDTTTCKTINLRVDNVDPTAAIDMSSAILINGVPTFLAQIGDTLPFSGRSTDPGSDDLGLIWDWDDGSPLTISQSLVNPPNPDPFPSPSVQPRDVTAAASHTYTEACLYEISFWSVDDDGGTSTVATANVIIVGDADDARSAGYWQTEYAKHLRDKGKPHFDAETLQCYLDIAGFMSQVFDEVVDASSFGAAADVLYVDKNEGDMTEIFDRQLLAAWLNFANGAIGYGELVDSDGDSVPDAPFANVMATAEATRLAPAPSQAGLEAQKGILEALNLMG